MSVTVVQVDVKIKRVDTDVSLPVYSSEFAAGADIRAFLPPRALLSILPGETVAVPTGLLFELPTGYEFQVRPRSGLSLKTGIRVANAPGTIDSDYRGELKVLLHNTGNDLFLVQNGDRIAQLVLAPVYRAVWQESYSLSDTIRGTGGFGSTGV